MRQKRDLDSKIELLNKEIVTKTTTKNGVSQEEDDYLRQELLYDYDLLVHMKGEMDEMIQTLETEEYHEEIHEDEEQVIDNRYFNKEII